MTQPIGCAPSDFCRCALFQVVIPDNLLLLDGLGVLVFCMVRESASMWVLLVKGDFFKMFFENESLNLDR